MFSDDCDCRSCSGWIYTCSSHSAAQANGVIRSSQFRPLESQTRTSSSVLLYLLATIRGGIRLWGYKLAPCAQFIICVMTGMHFWKASHTQISRVRRIPTSFWSNLVVLTVDTWSLLVDDYYTPDTATHAVYTSEPQSFGLDIYIGFPFSVPSKLPTVVELSLLCIGLQASWNRSKIPPPCALILSSFWIEHTYHKCGTDIMESLRGKT